MQLLTAASQHHSYDAATKTGGSNGATMRFAPESDHGANAGLAAARDFLEPIKAQFPWISYSDLWTLAGVCAIQEMQGPTIPWRPGRADHDVSFCTPDGRLPDASKEQKHLRAIFGRMGFNDQEIVALSGAHALGRCHTDRSGYDGPWTFSPTVLTNDYYSLLLDEKWQWRKWNGPHQYTDSKTKSLMMLPTDMALVKDKSFRTYVEKYAKDNDAFFADFSKVLEKLFELGVPFKQEEKFRFKPLISS
jgi:cytochrome c peroxidase